MISQDFNREFKYKIKFEFNLIYIYIYIFKQSRVMYGLKKYIS